MTPEWVKKIVRSTPVVKDVYAARNKLITALDTDKEPKRNPLAGPPPPKKGPLGF